MAKIRKIIVLLALILVLPAASYAVIDPVQGVATPNGNFIFVPNQITANTIKIVNATTIPETIVATKSVVGGKPVSMITSPDGRNLFVVATAMEGSYLNAYTIEATGALTLRMQRPFSAQYTAGRQCAITPDGKYLYVANFDNDPTLGTRVWIFNVSNPSSIPAPTYSGPIANFLWGLAMKPDGTRLYIGCRDQSGYKVYIYNIAGANRTNPSYIRSISLGTAKDPTFLAVDPDGTRLFVRVYEEADPGDGARKDIMVYNITHPTPVLTAEVYKIKGNLYKSELPGDHMITVESGKGYDHDWGNGFEGMALNPSGWFLYFTHFNGGSQDGMSFWRDTMYGVSVSKLDDGFQRDNDIWVSWGGYGTTDASPTTPVYGGWHSADGVIASRRHKVYFTYSNGGDHFTVPTTTDANMPPMAPVITYPSPDATWVKGNVQWIASVDDTPTPPGLTYTIEYILASTLEAGISDWQNMAYTGVNATSIPFAKVKAGQRYYLRIKAYDGTYTSPWAYTGPFTMADDYRSAPAWLNHYNIASREVIVNWEDTGATSYEVRYRVLGGAWSTTVEVIPWYNAADTNPNTRITGLTAQTTYEVMVRSLGTPWSTSHNFYTLETPWLDVYRTGTNETYILWGPIVSTGSIQLPLVHHFEVRYRKVGETAWTSWVNTTNATREDTKSINLNCRIFGLDPFISYEVTMRSVDDFGLSDSSREAASYWADVVTFETYPKLWLSSYHEMLDKTNLEWGVEGAGRTEPLADHYRLEFRLKGDLTWEVYARTLDNVTWDDHARTGPNITFEGNTGALLAYTTYEARIRAEGLGDVPVSNWSDICEFYTMDRPDWITAYNIYPPQGDLIWDTTIYSSYDLLISMCPSAELGSAYVVGPGVTYHMTGLVTQEWYYAKVRSISGTYRSYWSPIEAFYTLPAPQNVSVDNITLTTADLTWEPVNLATSYDVSYGTDIDATLEGVHNVASFPYNMSGLMPNTVYYVKVRARDAKGWSKWAPYPPLKFMTTTEAVIIDINPTEKDENGNPLTHGYRGATVKIQGQNLGTKGLISFECLGTYVNAQAGYWTNSAIAVSVPPTAIAGINNIIVRKNGGAPAINLATPYTVQNGRYILDDMEGGVWEYPTWEGGAGRVMHYGKQYSAPIPERYAFITAECQGSAPQYILGGISTYGDLTYEVGYDISGYKQIKLWFKGDGTSAYATFELVESNTSSGNLLSVPLAAEVYKYNVPIPLSSTSWETITILLTTEGASKFELDTGWWGGGDGKLDLTRIKAYQIMTIGGATKKYAVDYVYATGGTPILDLTVLMQGYYAPPTQRPSTVEVEFRNNTQTPVATYELALNANGRGTLDAVGLPNGNYYVVIKHKIKTTPPQASGGRNHLSIRASTEATFTSGVITTLNFSDTASPNYKAPYWPPSQTNDPMVLVSGMKVMRGGDANGSGTINAQDFTIWSVQNGKVPATWDPVNGPSADFNGSASINAQDYSIWNSNNGYRSYINM